LARKGRAGYWVQEIKGHGIGIKLFNGESEFHALGAAFAEAEYTATAKLQAGLFTAFAVDILSE